MDIWVSRERILYTGPDKFIDRFHANVFAVTFE